MYTKQGLTYQPLPLPDRHDMSDSEMSKNAEAFYDTSPDSYSASVPVWVMMQARSAV